MIKTIVIASVLKPVNDVRSYSKIAQSLAKTNKYEVNIIGNEGKKDPSLSNIRFSPHQIHRSQWLKRLFLKESILRKIIKLKPSLLIITSYELINVALITRIFTGCKVIYDVQENYSANVKLKRGFFRKIASQFIRMIETIGSLFIDQYWLAESCYSNELNFIKNKWIVVENKATDQPTREGENTPLKLLFSGTISHYSGAELALDLMEKMILENPETEGCIIGQIHDQKLKSTIVKRAQSIPQIELIISESPIDHDQILSKINWSNLGIISYQVNAVNKRKVPTKQYEYSRYRLPYLIQENTHWSEFGLKLGGSISIDFSNFSVEDINTKVKNSSQLFPESYPIEFTWEYESTLIIKSIESLI